VIRTATGLGPVTCPWRSFDDPVVQAAAKLRRHWEKGTIDVGDQLAVVIEAMEMIDGVSSHVYETWRREKREIDEANARVAKAKSKR